MNADAFQELDAKVEDFLDRGVRADSDPREFFDRGPLVAKWLVKQNCNSDPTAHAASSGDAVLKRKPQPAMD